MSNKLESLDISRKMIISIVIAVANFFLLYILNIILANQMDQAEFGEFAVAVTSVNFLAQLSALGLDKLSSRYLPIYWQDHAYEEGHGFIRHSSLIALASSLSIAIIGVVVMGFFVKDGTQHPLFIAIWLIPLVTFIRISSFWINTTGNYIAAQIPRLLQDPVITIALVFLVFWFEHIISSYLAIKLFGVALISVFIVQLLFLKVVLPKKLFQYKPAYERKKWLRMSFPMMLVNSLIFLCFSQINIWLLEFISGDEASVGIYSAIYLTVSFFNLILVAVIIFIEPLLSKVLVTNKKAEINKVLIASQRILILSALFSYLIFVFFGKSILGLFGPGYVSAYPALLISGIGVLIQLATGLSLTILQNTGHEWIVLYGTVIALVLHFLLIIIIIPIYHLIGVVIVTSIIFSCLYFWFVYLAWHYLKINIFVLHI